MTGDFSDNGLRLANSRTPKRSNSFDTLYLLQVLAVISGISTCKPVPIADVARLLQVQC